MLLLRKVLLTEAMAAIWTAAKSLFSAFMAAARGIDGVLAQFLFAGILHTFSIFSS
jgi:hypothetical protein